MRDFFQFLATFPKNCEFWASYVKFVPFFFVFCVFTIYFVVFVRKNLPKFSSSPHDRPLDPPLKTRGLEFDPRQVRVRFTVIVEYTLWASVGANATPPWNLKSCSLTAGQPVRSFASSHVKTQSFAFGLPVLTIKHLGYF